MNIIVTGASRGIGFELVKLFCKQNGNTVIAIARNAEKLESLRKEVTAINGTSSVIPMVCDLNEEAQVISLAKNIAKRVPTIDILINNAGAIVNKPFLSLSKNDVQTVYNVNVFSVMSLIQQLLPAMNQQKRSHIVTIGSMGGFQGSSKFSGLSAYSSSKAALACLTECLAEEFKTMNTAFNCLALGAAQTEMLEEAFPGYKAPLSAQQMATFIADFAQNAQGYLNGKIIPVSMSNP